MQVVVQQQALGLLQKKQEPCLYQSRSEDLPKQVSVNSVVEIHRIYCCLSGTCFILAIISKQKTFPFQTKILLQRFPFQTEIVLQVCEHAGIRRRIKKEIPGDTVVGAGAAATSESGLRAVPRSVVTAELKSKFSPLYCTWMNFWWGLNTEFVLHWIELLTDRSVALSDISVEQQD